MNIRIRQASAEDAAAIVKIGAATFIEAFAAFNTTEGIQDYISKNFYEEKILEELNCPGSVFFLAFDADTVIGYTKLNTGDAQTEPQGADALEIERIYVSAAYYGKAVGQLLMDTGINYARQAGYRRIWLGVWEENQRALAFYRKVGFVPFGTHVFTIGKSDQTDIMMQQILA
ncbi:GNAT family N-acetyltransferase [Chitinophaga rhizophila]|uniref:GNAT family N-acetyltransferase n=1 Tax=Chitinophaga rhizophila TaxID=2866212 RepID=A0ABS7G898_9BACT|nr:GNAT family N-acetyltransferase [Chitinophaga rhizophila]MBW8683009.1 GNAT family N-acetyltransferase [Chitinophaga rhizophila]